MRITQVSSSAKPARRAAARKRSGGSKGGSSVSWIVPQCMPTIRLARSSQAICTVLQCQPGDLLEFRPDDPADAAARANEDGDGTTA